MSGDIDRPAGYQYLKILEEHLGGLERVFDGKLIYPRQLEIHLPADHRRPCNFSCPYCQGRLLEQSLGNWEAEALKLMGKLGGRIPYYIFGGAYSEPLLNPYFMAFLLASKECGANFGIHTNGSFLKCLEERQGWITELCRLAEGKQDYLSVSLDAGTAQSHTRSKGLDRDRFTEIIDGIGMAVEARGGRDYPAIRICYLLNRQNSSRKEMESIIRIAKDLGVDSLRFSIPYALYGQHFNEVRSYRNRVEVERNKIYQVALGTLVSRTCDEKPFIFYLPPQYQDVNEMNFRQCIYSYYQITFGADGFVYKCSSCASPSFSNHRLGRITDDLGKFDEMVLANHDPDWDAKGECWSVGARCNRMALECNKAWRDRQ